MSSINSAVFSLVLTDRKAKDGESVRRLASYSYYNGKTKGEEDAPITVVGYGNMAERLSDFNPGPVIVEGRIAIGEPRGESKDRPLELIASRFHI